ncbi:MAG: DUF3164 family protein [Candidatus Paceibacterota bacterium]|jgi:hypothetical protein
MLNENDFMPDHRGNLVPKTMVKSIDLLRNDLVNKIVDQAIRTSNVLTSFKALATTEIVAFVEQSATEYNVTIGGIKGNIQLLSFDGKYKVIKSINDYIVFDERIQVAKQLVDECISKWSKDAMSEIQILVNHAFEVDKQGKINTERILGLRRLNIDDEQWKKAMDAIGDSIQITGSKEYIRVYERKNNGKYEQIPLDLSSV